MSEAVHYKKEHHDHEDLIKVSLELQEALQSTIEETTLVEEFRAFFEKSIGESDDSIDQMFQEAGASKKIINKAKSMQRDLVRAVEIRLARIINRFEHKATEARKKVVLLAKMMGKEIELDAQETKKFGERLQEWGVDEEYAEKLERQYDDETEDEDGEEEGVGEEDVVEEEEAGVPPNGGRVSLEERRRRKAEESHQSEKEISAQLDSFFKKLQVTDFPIVPPALLPKLETLMETTLQGLGDELKETDLQIVAKRFEEMIVAEAPGVPATAYKYDAAKHDSVIDFFESFIERAKLSPHKQNLLDLYNGWKAPNSKITALTVLANIEKITKDQHMLRLFDMMEGMEIDPSTGTLEEIQKVSPIEKEIAAAEGNQNGGGGEAAGDSVGSNLAAAVAAAAAEHAAVGQPQVVPEVAQQHPAGGSQQQQI